VIGGGVVGCAAAAFLAEAGAKVEVYERDEVGSGASGRNSGVVQHPFDPVLAELHTETVDILRSLEHLELPEEPAGVLMLSRDRSEVEAVASEIAREVPELDPVVLGPRELAGVEPALAPGVRACRLETGYPVGPLAATRALARRAHAAGAVFREHEVAWPWIGAGRARGVIAAGVRRAAESVLVTAGPWTPEVVDTTRAWRPIGAVWGVVLEIALPEPPRHVVEQTGVEAVAAGPQALQDGAVFSAVPAPGGESVSLGSTFLRDEPEPEAWEGRIRRAARDFLPGVAGAEVIGLRACARPQSFDGRPLVGPALGIDRLWVAAGHGPWGISTGAATGRLVADALLGRGEIPAALSAARASG
jgi:sarcosine oxidase subunit beta